MFDTMKQFTERLIIQKAKMRDDAVFGYIQEIATENGIDETRITLNEDAIVKAFERQIPKKPYKVKEHKQDDYYCTVCKRYLGDEMELKHSCLQPKYCRHCGQRLDWSDLDDKT